MSLENVAYDGLIKARAEALDRVPTQQHIEMLGEVLKTLVRHDAAANVLTVEEDEGQHVDFVAYVDAAVAKFPAKPAPVPEPAAPDAWIKVTLGGSTGWRKANDPMTAILKGLQASGDAALAREVSTLPNPWLPGQINRTHQVLITKSDPARAARFKAEAGTA